MGFKERKKKVQGSRKIHRKNEKDPKRSKGNTRKSTRENKKVCR